MLFTYSSRHPNGERTNQGLQCLTYWKISQAFNGNSLCLPFCPPYPPTLLLAEEERNEDFKHLENKIKKKKQHTTYTPPKSKTPPNLQSWNSCQEYLDLNTISSVIMFRNQQKESKAGYWGSAECQESNINCQIPHDRGRNTGLRMEQPYTAYTDSSQTIRSGSDSASNVCKIPPSFSAKIPGTTWRLQFCYQAIIDGRKKNSKN